MPTPLPTRADARTTRLVNEILYGVCAGLAFLLAVVSSGVLR